MSRIEAADKTQVTSAAPKPILNDSPWASLRVEAISRMGTDADSHPQDEANGNPAVDVGSEETAYQREEASAIKAISNNDTAARSNVNGHPSGESYPDPESVIGKANGHVSVASSPPTQHTMAGDTMNVDPITIGERKGSVAATSPIESPEDFWSPATRLKHRLEDTKDLIVCPGVYDGFSARIALSVGFDAMYMTGAGTTASRLGMADLGVASRTEMKDHADMIANLDPSKMLIADMDTGYGGPITITTTVNQYIRANVAGFHIEDQLLTKRCGHLAGKKVVSRETYLSRIKAAKAAKDRARSDIILIARTDANQQHGYDECLARLRAARDVGADVGLLEGFKSKEEARRAVRDLAPWPLLLNMVENGHSPLITVDEARDMGFRIMIFSFGAMVPAYLAIKSAFERLRDEGVTGVHETGVSPRSIFEVCGLEEAMEVDEVAGGEDFKGGV